MVLSEMLRHFTIVFFIFADVSGIIEICDVPLYRHCPAEALPTDMPRTVQDLSDFCDNSPPYFDCAADYVEKCTPGGSGYMEQMRTGILVLCNKEDVLYNAVADNMQCVMENLHKIRQCNIKESVEYKADDFSKSLEKHGVTESWELEESANHCMEPLFEFSCMAVNMERICGTIAKDTAIQLAQLFSFAIDICTPKVLENLPAIVRVFELEEEERKMLDSMLRKK